MINRIYISIIIITLSLFVQNLYGQKIFEQDNPMSMGVKPGHVVKLGMEKVKDAEKVWMSYMKEAGVKLKKNRKAGEFYAEDIDLYSIGQGNTFNLYSRIQESAVGAELIVWIDLGSSFMTSAGGEGYANLVGVLTEVEKQARVTIENEGLKEEEGNLKKIEKSLDKLVSNKAKYEKNIQKAKDAIAENEQNIVTNGTDQESIKVDIEAQKAKLEVIKAKIAEIQAEK